MATANKTLNQALHFKSSFCATCRGIAQSHQSVRYSRGKSRFWRHRKPFSLDVAMKLVEDEEKRRCRSLTIPEVWNVLVTECRARGIPMSISESWYYAKMDAERWIAEWEERRKDKKIDVKDPVRSNPEHGNVRWGRLLFCGVLVYGLVQFMGRSKSGDKPNAGDSPVEKDDSNSRDGWRSTDDP